MQNPDGPETFDDPAGLEDTHEEFPKAVKRSPVTPSHAERDSHEARGHATFRNWCDSCVKGRGRDGKHCGKVREDGEVPVLSWDYGFLGAKGHESKHELDEMATRLGWSPVLCCRDRASHGCYWYLLPTRGTDFVTFGPLVKKDSA